MFILEPCRRDWEAPPAIAVPVPAASIVAMTPAMTPTRRRVRDKDMTLLF
jgi:hypothetical protein